MIRENERKLRLGSFAGPLVCGVDEAGRGPLAGPVVAAAVILPSNFDTSGIADSKKLTPLQRAAQRSRIEESHTIWTIGVVGHETVDRINILNASLLAMKIAVDKLPVVPDIVYVDGKFEIPQLRANQLTIIGGDGRESVIGAASIMAKTYRDELMLGFDKDYPGYGFGRHKGYPTREHIRCLNRLGPSPVHRKSFHRVREFYENGKYTGK